MKMQARLSETWTVAVDIVSDNRPASGCCLNAQLMSAPGDGFEREPCQTIAASHHFPVGHRLLPVGVDLLPPAAFGVEPAEGHVDRAFVLHRAAFHDGPIGF